MVKSAINVRRSSICWRGRRELTDVRKPEIMVMTSLQAGELFTGYSDHPHQACHAKPDSNQQAPDATASFPLVGCLPQAAAQTSTESQDAVALQQIKERGALPMIDRGDMRQAIDRCSNIWKLLPGAGYGQFEHKADGFGAKFKEAGGTVRD